MFFHDVVLDSQVVRGQRTEKVTGSSLYRHRSLSQIVGTPKLKYRQQSPEQEMNKSRTNENDQRAS